MNEIGTDDLEFLTQVQIKRLLATFPETKRLLKVKGTTADYYSQLQPAQLAPPDNRRKPFLAELERSITSVHGKVDADSVLDQMETDSTLSTAEHLNSITEPFTLNTVYNQALYRKARSAGTVLSVVCATVRLNNLLSPRSFFLGEQKIHFFSEKSRKNMAHCMPAFDPTSVGKKLEKELLSTDLAGSQKDAILQWWSDYVREISPFGRFWEQLSVFNRLFWEAVVGLNKLPLPDRYIMVPSSIVVRDALIKELESKDVTWMTNLLCSENKLKKLIGCFDGIRSCWDTSQGTGTILFWGNVDKRPIPLFLNNGCLKSQDSEITVVLEREALIEALAADLIIPASNFVMLYLFFYLKLNIFGGLLQVQYLPAMQNRFLEVNPLGLDKDELQLTHQLDPGLYLNFEIRRISNGGLIRMVEPIGDNDFDTYKKRSFQGEIQGCLGYLYDLAIS